MGETICKKCKYMNWHIKAHATGKCEYCGKPILWCDSCRVVIKAPEEWAIKFLKNPAEFINKGKK